MVRKRTTMPGVPSSPGGTTLTVVTTLEGSPTMATDDAARRRQLGRVMRAGLTARDMTLADLSLALGRPSRTVRRWLDGENAPALWDVLPLSRALGLPVEWLLDPDAAPLTKAVREVEEYRLAEAWQERAGRSASRAVRKSARRPDRVP